MDLYCVIGIDCDEPTSPILCGYSENLSVANKFMYQLLDMQVDSDLYISAHRVACDRDLIGRILHENPKYDDNCLVQPDNILDCHIVSYPLGPDNVLYITEGELEDIASQIETSEEYLDDLRTTIIEVLFYMRFLKPYVQDQIRESLRSFIKLVSIATAPRTKDSHLPSLEDIIDPVAVYAYQYNII